LYILTSDCEISFLAEPAHNLIAGITVAGDARECARLVEEKTHDNKANVSSESVPSHHPF
jgi:hypothetical protein